MARDKCLSYKEWCDDLHGIMTEFNGSGINPVTYLIRKSIDPVIVGVAFKKWKRNKPKFFNFCPFCGQNIAPPHSVMTEFESSLSYKKKKI